MQRKGAKIQRERTASKIKMEPLNENDQIGWCSEYVYDQKRTRGERP